MRTGISPQPCDARSRPHFRKRNSCGYRENHPLLTQQFGGYDLGAGHAPRSAGPRGQRSAEARLVRITPLLEGVQLDGRWVVVFSPYDISCAMENAASLECKGYIKADAARMVVNIVLFALQQ